MNRSAFFLPAGLHLGRSMDRDVPPVEESPSPIEIAEESVTPGGGPEAVAGWKLPNSLRALKQRNYRLYFFGQLVSMTGSWMQTTALTWVIFDMTHESRWPANIATAQILPTFLLGAWGGSLADRWPKRELIFVTQAAALIQALILFALVGLGVHEPWMLVAVTGLGGLIQAVDFPARLAFVLDLTSREDLMNAVALNSAVFNVARVVGPALGGLTLYLLGPGMCFLLNAASYLAVLWALWLMRIDKQPIKTVHASGWRTLMGGLSYLRKHREMAWLLVLVATTSMTGWPFMARCRRSPTTVSTGRKGLQRAAKLDRAWRPDRSGRCRQVRNHGAQATFHARRRLPGHRWPSWPGPGNERTCRHPLVQPVRLRSDSVLGNLPECVAAKLR